MKPKLKTGLISAVPVALFLGLGMVLAKMLGLQGLGYRLFWMAFAAMGAVLGGMVFWLMRRRSSEKDVPVQPPQVEELAVRLGEIKKRLAAAKRPGLDNLPVVVLLGPPGSGKSSLVGGSGTSAEQLAGDPQRGGENPPTSSINAWYADGTVLVECGSKLAEDPSLWSTLVRRILPRRLAAAIFTGKSQAPRAAVVCLSCEDLAASANDPENLLAWARALRAQLLELSQRLGVRLPVYVLFTKTDTVQSFDEYFWDLTEEESRRVLGATLSLSPDVGAAGYGEHQTKVLARAFKDIYRSLAIKRLKYLDLTGKADRAVKAYEFPREFRKLGDTATRFLVELCKPSQLQVSPFLRGFYFSGRKETLVEGAPAAPEAPPEPAPVAGGATMVFDPSAMAQAAPPPVRESGGPAVRTRQWLFLPRVFTDVVMRDDIAIGMMRGGRRVSFGRRFLLGGVTFVILFLLTPFLFSAFVQNRRLQSRAEEGLVSLREVQATDPSGAGISNALMRMEELRDDADTLSRYREEGPPLRYGGWLGLYAGPRIYPVVMDEYAARFSPLLLRPALDSVVADLRVLPEFPTPESDYQVTYDLLKTYLITTRYPDSTDAALVARVLADHWSLSGGAVDDSLASLQFQLFGRHLVASDRFDNPPADEAVIVRTRDFLSRMSAVQPFYVSLTNKASQLHREFRLEDLVYQGTSPALAARAGVPGAFTLDGREYVKAQLARPDSIMRVEEWVLGPVALPDPTEVVQGIDSLYEAEYTRRWTDLLGQVYVPAFQSARDAARKLGDLAGDDSPLIELLTTVSNTVWQQEGTGEGEFLPLNAFLPRDSAGNLGLSESANTYFDVLDQLQSAMEDLDQAQGTETLAQADAISMMQIPEGERAVRILRREMGAEPGGRAVSNHLENLLAQPIDRVSALVRGVEPRELNQRGAEFCTEFDRRVGTRYPFSTASSEGPDMGDLAAVFQRGNSLVWNLGSALDSYIERSGPVYRQRAGSTVQINPSFLDFYAQARRFSESVFAEGAQNPLVEFSVRPSLSESSPGVESISITVNGDQRVCTPLDCRTLTTRWDGSPSSEVELTARIDGENVRIVGPVSGSWAIFRLFEGARGWRSAGEAHTIRWQVGGSQRTVAVVVDLGRVPPVFNASSLRAMQCEARIAGR